jgi:hypothetical protein
MISLDFSLAIAGYTFLFLCLVLLAWLFGRRQKDRDLRLDPRHIWFCSICSYTYINTKEEVITVCPRCGSYNKRSVNL